MDLRLAITHVHKPNHHVTTDSLHFSHPNKQIFDNTYAWFASKQLSYSVQLRYPTGPAFEQERMLK